MHRVRTFTLCILAGLLTVAASQNTAGVKPTNGAPARTPIKALPLTSRQTRPKRSAGDVITDCMAVKAGPGKYYIKAENAEEQLTCDLYLAALPEELIQVRFDEFNVACDDGGKVSFVDGWEINQQLYPNPQDHQIPFDQRAMHFCNEKKITTRLVSSQNAAMIRYTFPRSGGGFTITVDYIVNETPCNVLAADEIVHVLSNYGIKQNCTVTGMYYGKVKILQANLPADDLQRRRFWYWGNRRQEMGGLEKNCRKRGSGNYLQIGGTDRLDATEFAVAGDYCGLASKPDSGDVVIGCKITIARLVSDGTGTISATIRMKRQDEGDENLADASCQA